MPIKTLNLPHGGKASPISAYSLLMDMVAYATIGTLKEDPGNALYVDDLDGSATINTLKTLQRVLSRITGNGIESLGLHPAVFFYSRTGKHLDMLLLAVISVFSKAIRNNDGDFFKKFTRRRSIIEDVFLNHKELVGQANFAFRSRDRVEKWASFIESVARGKLLKVGFSSDELIEALDLQGKILVSEDEEAGANISDLAKSAVFLKQMLSTAGTCTICGGLVHFEKSASYDHVQPKSKGGGGNHSNVQITHPYCNSLKGNNDIFTLEEI